MAPNGYGKSTITTAFKAATHGSMKLSKDDYFEGDEENIPKLEIEYTDGKETYSVVSDNKQGNVSKAFTIFTVSSPVYAKSTGRSMSGFATHTAAMYIHDIEICKIPQKAEIEYKYTDYKRKFGKETINIGAFLLSEDGLAFIIDNKFEFGKCVEQKGIQRLLDSVNSKEGDIDSIMKQKILCSLIKGLEKDCKIKDENTAIIYLIQIIDILKKEGFDVFHKTYEWVRYKKSRFLIDERLEEFNTTGLNLCAKKKKENLVISFGRADRMSNGERDVLSFVASLIAFEIQVKNKPGILIVDEVFDYLDGANLLAAQYYLSKMVENLRRKGKIIIPIIMTHLDPSVFASYSFKKMAVHYLTSKSNIDLDDCVVKMLLLRSQLKEHNHLQSSDYEKYLLHFHLDNWNIPEDILEQLPEGFPSDSNTWRDYLYREVEEKYLGGSDYNAPAVIIALRMKVEENTVRLLPENKREEYFSQHGSNNKLPYAESCNCDIPELFYLLQPLYNDSAHLRNGKWADKENRNKIESAYLKITSPIIRMMIQEVFQM